MLEPVPETVKEPVVDSYFGTQVTDNYRWLENLQDPNVRRWAETQNAHAERYLKALPDRTRLAAQIKELISSTPPSISMLTISKGDIFGIKIDPSKQQPFLVFLSSTDRQAIEKTVCDPNSIDPSGRTSIDWFVPSHDARLVAVSLSKDGSEDGNLYFFDVATGKQYPDVLTRVQYPTGGGSAAWNRDSTAIYYTRYPHPGERPAEDLHFYQQVYLHRIGTSESEDVYAIGRDFPKIAEVSLQSREDSDFVVATVANGDGGDFAHFVGGPDKNWNQLTHFEDKVKKGELGPQSMFYAISLADAPHGKVVRYQLRKTSDNTTIVSSGDGVIENIALTDNRLLVHLLQGGPSALYIYTLDGTDQKIAPIPQICNVSAVVTGKDLALVDITSYTERSKWLIYDTTGNSLSPAAFNTKSPVNFDDLTVTRVFAVSKDGTRVPLNIVHKKGLDLNGDNPTILYGYGGYGLSETPRVFLPLRAWYDLGGIYVDTNLRGGGEFGEEWHKQGSLTNKQNVFDDFAACAQYLINNKYTSVSELGMLGGSNGGLLMGAMIVQHPGLMKAVVSEAGIYDSLRSELEPNGLFNTTEFGSVKDPAQFKALYAYSPYHHVVDGAIYPAILLTAGLNDGRVAAHNSFKFLARLQSAAANSKNPILLRVNSFGHGFGNSLDQEVNDWTDVFSFFDYELKEGANQRAKSHAAGR